MLPFRTKANPYMLVVGMSGVKMGDRMVQIGCSDGGALAAVAAKVGLSGRALAIVPDEPALSRVQKGAEAAGVLVEADIAPSTALPVDEADFSLAVIDDAAGQFAAMPAETQTATVREALRVVHPGGRILVVSALPATGLTALLGRGKSGPAFDAMPVLEMGGCRYVRVLGEREGLRFVEGIKARS